MHTVLIRYSLSVPVTIFLYEASNIKKVRKFEEHSIMQRSSAIQTTNRKQHLFRYRSIFDIFYRLDEKPLDLRIYLAEA